MNAKVALEIQIWSIDKLVFYARNPRKNDAAVDRMCSSIREFGFKIPVLARSDGEVIDGHLRLKAARQLGIVEVPVILCDEWTPAQVKAFRLMVNRSVTWADWDEELLALEFQELCRRPERFLAVFVESTARGSVTTKLSSRVFNYERNEPRRNSILAHRAKNESNASAVGGI